MCTPSEWTGAEAFPSPALHQETRAAGVERDCSGARSLSVVQPLLQDGENLTRRAFDPAPLKGGTFIARSFSIRLLKAVSHWCFHFRTMHVQTATHSCWQKTPKKFFNPAGDCIQSICRLFPSNYLGSRVFMFFSL